MIEIKSGFEKSEYEQKELEDECDIEEDTIFYADSEKVRSYMHKLTDLIITAKAKSIPGSTKLPEKIMKELDEIFE